MGIVPDAGGLVVGFDEGALQSADDGRAAPADVFLTATPTCTPVWTNIKIEFYKMPLLKYTNSHTS